MASKELQAAADVARWNGKESEAVVRQLRAPGLDAASRKRR